MAAKAIDYRFKILYAFAIVMVCCGHLRQDLFVFSEWFTFFDAPSIFVFCSGYFYNEKSLSNVSNFIKKKISKLLIPLYVYNFVYGVFVVLIKHIGFNIGEDFNIYNLLIAPITHGHQFVFNLGGWFVVPLFMIEIYNVLLRKLLNGRNISESFFFLFSLLLGVIGNWLAYQGYNHGWWLVLVRMLYFLPFFELGIFFRNKLEKCLMSLSNFSFLAIVFSIKLTIICFYGYNVGSFVPAWCNNFPSNPLLPIIVCFLSIAFWVRIATILEPVIGKSRIVNLIANNTFSIMMNHLLGFTILGAFFAMINKIGLGFADFDWNSFKTSIWWHYIPFGLSQTLVLYVVVGIGFSIIIQKIVDNIKFRVMHLIK